MKCDDMQCPSVVCDGALLCIAIHIWAAMAMMAVHDRCEAMAGNAGLWAIRGAADAAGAAWQCMAMGRIRNGVHRTTMYVLIYNGASSIIP